MKTIKTTILKLINYVSLAFAMASVGLTPIYATNVFDAGGTLAESLWTQIKTFYTDKAFPLLLVANLVLLAFTKNEKRLELLKKSLFIVCVVFVALHCIDLIKNTLTGFSNTLNGTP